MQASRFGIVETRFDVQGLGEIRTRPGAGQASPPFSLKPVWDGIYNPFGLPELLEPKQA